MLNNNIFTYGGNFYRQIRGLPMGNRLSGTLAIICMDRFEHTHINTTYQPYFYGRYVDDIGTFVNNVEEAELMLTDLNSKHPTIAFEQETPNEDKFLPILDLMIRVNKEGQVERKLYCKPASKGITLNFSSHQPSTTKRAMVNAELLRAETYPTSEFVQAAVNHTKSKLLNNGYPATCPARPRQNKKTRPDKESLFTLKIPFLSDGFNYKIRKSQNRTTFPLAWSTQEEERCLTWRNERRQHMRLAKATFAQRKKFAGSHPWSTWPLAPYAKIVWLPDAYTIEHRSTCEQ